MMVEITKIEKWRTPDGVEHLSIEMAHQHLANKEMLDLLDGFDIPESTRQDIVNYVEGNRDVILRYFAATDAMKRKHDT